MEWAVSLLIVTVHLITIYNNFRILYDVIFIDLNYKFYFCPMKYPFLKIPENIQIVRQWGSPAVDRWDSCSGTLLS
jgi:hypothetical protein